jgi:hypothetical protein
MIFAKLSMYIQFFKREWSMLCKQISETFFHYCDTKSTALHYNYLKINEKVSGLELRSDLRHSVESLMTSVLTSESTAFLSSAIQCCYGLQMHEKCLQPLVSLSLNKEQNQFQSHENKTTKLLQCEVGSTMKNPGY